MWSCDYGQVAAERGFDLFVEVVAVGGVSRRKVRLVWCEEGTRGWEKGAKEKGEEV